MPSTSESVFMSNQKNNHDYKIEEHHALLALAIILLILILLAS